MILDVKPLQNTPDCVEDALISVFEWFKKGYKSMFLNAWCFEFEPDKNNGPVWLGNCLQIERSFDLDLLKKYHGISISFFSPSNTDITNLIIEELKKRKPVILIFEMTYAPWSEYYKESVSNIHALIVTGVDEEQGNFYCTDTTQITQELVLPFQNVQTGTYEASTFSFDDYEQISWHDSLEFIIERVKKKNLFEEIIKFGEFFESAFDLETEIADESDITEILIQKKLYNIMNNRKKFLLALQHIDTYQLLTDFSETYSLLISKWDFIRVMILKFIIGLNCKQKLDVPKMLARIKNKIFETADFERETLKLLHDINNTGSLQNKIQKANTNNVSTDGLKKENDIIFLDLSSYFNNKAIEVEVTENITANICGTGQFLLYEAYRDNMIITVEDMSFQMADLSTNSFDNISSATQIISANNAHYSKIMILGFAEWGSFSEKMTVKYEDNTCTDILVGLTNWDSEPEYNEKIALKAKGGNTAKGKTEFFDFDVFLFAKSYELLPEKKLKEIVLPNCSFMHIFAISIQ